MSYAKPLEVLVNFFIFRFFSWLARSEGRTNGNLSLNEEFFRRLIDFPSTEPSTLTTESAQKARKH